VEKGRRMKVLKRRGMVVAMISLTGRITNTSVRETSLCLRWEI
jgi:hypothetical protein